jgi:hypothetical protein
MEHSFENGINKIFSTIDSCENIEHLDVCNKMINNLFNLFINRDLTITSMVASKILSIYYCRKKHEIEVREIKY